MTWQWSIAYFQFPSLLSQLRNIYLYPRKPSIPALSHFKQYCIIHVYLSIDFCYIFRLFLSAMSCNASWRDIASRSCTRCFNKRICSFQIDISVTHEFAQSFELSSVSILNVLSWVEPASIEVAVRFVHILEECWETPGNKWCGFHVQPFRNSGSVGNGYKENSSYNPYFHFDPTPPSSVP